MLQFVMNMQTLSFHLGGQTKILYQQLPCVIEQSIRKIDSAYSLIFPHK